jgi:hypothetical protein
MEMVFVYSQLLISGNRQVSEILLWLTNYQRLIMLINDSDAEQSEQISNFLISKI